MIREVMRRILAASPISTTEGRSMFEIACRGFISMVIAAALALLPSLDARAQSGQARNKVVFQVSDSDSQKWNLALNNAKNLQDDLGKEGVELEIVVYGP